jgi:hypothetical protein
MKLIHLAACGLLLTAKTALFTNSYNPDIEVGKNSTARRIIFRMVKIFLSWTMVVLTRYSVK